MKAIKLTTISALTQEQLGGKGYNLQKLICRGFSVPETYVIPADVSRHLDKGKQSFPEISKSMKSANAVYAVRSSGIGEDGNENSFAGIFDTMLNVKSSDLNDAILKVYSSKDTSVTSMYSHARNANVTDMAIIIQKMVSADFAGVAFSVNPVEQDHKIGLIEIVKGLGESLVSGKVKPTSLRVNRITGMHRVLQTGTDMIPERQLEHIVEAVSDALWKIADLYDKPVDIEWAIEGSTLYLLQARPITTLGDLI